MKLSQIWCHIKSYGTHYETDSFYYGDHHCTRCNRYLYTVYDSKASLSAMRNSWKMWWEIKE